MTNTNGDHGIREVVWKVFVAITVVVLEAVVDVLKKK